MDLFHGAVDLDEEVVGQTRFRAVHGQLVKYQGFSHGMRGHVTGKPGVVDHDLPYRAELSLGEVQDRVLGDGANPVHDGRCVNAAASLSGHG